MTNGVNGCINNNCGGPTNRLSFTRQGLTAVGGAPFYPFPPELSRPTGQLFMETRAMMSGTTVGPRLFFGLVREELKCMSIFSHSPALPSEIFLQGRRHISCMVNYSAGCVNAFTDAEDRKSLPGVKEKE